MTKKDHLFKCWNSYVVEPRKIDDYNIKFNPNFTPLSFNLVLDSSLLASLSNLQS